MPNPAWIARSARIELAEDLIALAIDLAEAVAFIEAREPGPEDEAELIRILIVAAKLKQTALTLRNETDP